MSMEDFKFIYWMEYAHRMWGRGFWFHVCFAFHIFSCKRIYHLATWTETLSTFYTWCWSRIDWWWMVRSGLEEPASEYVQPRVSPYRLATHLTSAFVIYCGILWTALSVVIPEPPNGSIAWVQSAAKGHAYNTFPKMGDSWIPDDIFSMEPLICNFFGNTSTVQVTWGVSTLLSYVPVSLGSAHQAGALTLLTLMILLTRTVRKPSPAALKSLALLPKI